MVSHAQLATIANTSSLSGIGSSMKYSGSTIENGPRTVIDTDNDGTRRYRIAADLGELDPWETWPRPNEKQGGRHPYYIARDNARAFEDEGEQLQRELFPRCRDLGDEEDDPGKLAKLTDHRVAEHATAKAMLTVGAPRAKTISNWEAADRLYRRAEKMWPLTS